MKLLCRLFKLTPYTRHPQKGEKLVIGKRNTQRIESKHLNFRTRIKRLDSPYKPMQVEI